MLVIASAIDNHLPYGSLLELDEPSPRRTHRRQRQAASP